MATRSTISIKTGDTIETIYCHWDGYPSHNGKILLESYQDENKVKELIALGDISSLAPNVAPIGPKGLIRKPLANEYQETTEPHTFDNPWKDVVVAYGRDRGETGIEARKTTGNTPLISEEWDYLFIDSEWHYRPGRGGFRKLTKDAIGD